MLKQQLTRTGILVAIIVVAAHSADFLINAVILHTPQAITPWTTLIIALSVGGPISYYLVYQRQAVMLARTKLSDSIAEKDQALAEARAAVAVKADFLANMTHELRTPLNAIVGFSGLLSASADLSVRDARQVELIRDASQTLLSVVNDVLDFSKLEAGAVEPEAHPFDPRRLAESAVALLARQAEERGVTLSLTLEGLDGALLGDGARLRQVLLNFLSNAIKFTAQGEVAVRLHQDVAEQGRLRRLRVEVRDSGIGVPADQIESIFGRFTQSDASVSRRYGGTGLGLAICQRIVALMGGDIGVESQVGRGSTFWFEVDLPAATTLETDDEVIASPIAADRPMRLLVVEDNAVNRELIAALLEPFDLILETANDGVEAIEAVRRSPFDLILMDIQMPHMDGLTATRRIRAAEAGGRVRVPIVAMTANVLPEQVARCLDAGMDDHLGKPISPQKLLETLARWSEADEAAPAEPALG